MIFVLFRKMNRQRDAVICVAASKILRCLIYTLYFWITGRSDHNVIVKEIIRYMYNLYCTELHFKIIFVSTNFQKRPCLEDSSWHTENTSNLETENRLLSCTQPPTLGNQLHDSNQPFLDHNSAANNDHVDINCNVVYRLSNCQEMDISFDSVMTRNQVRLHQQNLCFLFGYI